MRKIYFLLGITISFLMYSSSANAQCLTAPFTESFDAGTQPSCVLISAVTVGPWDFNGISWNTTGCGGTPSDHTGNGGEFASMDHSTPDAGVVLEFDTIDVSTLTNPYLTFYHFMCGSGYSPVNILAVETWNGTAWVGVDTIQQGNNTWLEYNYNLAGHTFGTNYLKVRFRAEPGGSSSTFYGDQALDDISITEAPSCIVPFGLNMVSSTTNSAVLGWTEQASAASWQIEYGLAGFTPGSGTTIVTSTNPHTLGSLTSNTAYEFYVRSICSPGDTSSWSFAGSFQTACSFYAVPFTETFNASSATQSCWTVLNVNGDADVWDMDYTSNSFEGGQSAMMYTDGNGGANDDYLISPQITLTGAEQLRYYYRTQSATEPNDYEVLISTTGNTPADFTTSLLADTVSNTSYQEQILDLSSYSGNVYVAFHAFSGGLDGWRLYIDSVNFEALPTCPKPSDLTSGNITATSADLSWTENGTALSWEIEYGGVGFTPGSGTTIVTSSNPYSLGGLAPDSTYTYVVRAICGPGDTSSLPFTDHTFNTPCATVIAPYSEDFENGGSIPDCWANTGSENWLFNNSGTGHLGNAGTMNGATASGGYFAWIDDSSPNSIGSGLESPYIDVSGLSNPRLTFYTISDNEGDSNVDFHVDIFDGANWNDSVYFNDTNTIAGAWEYIIVDLSSLTFTGPIKVRFVIDEVNGSDFDDDRAIDDMVIEETPACAAPTALTSMLNSSSSATLGWTENGTATSWQIEYDTAGFPQGTGTMVVTSNNPETITGLAAETDYDYYVRAICGPGDTSGWSLVSAVFTTPCAAFVAPYSEDFENAGSIPNCWTMAGSENWLFNNSGTGHLGNAGTMNGNTTSGGYFAWIDDSSPNNIGSSLYSPFIDVSGLTNPWLTFYTISDNEGDSNVDFHVDIFDGANWNDSVYFNDTNTINGAWEFITVDLSALTFTGPIQIRFVIDEVNGTDFDDDRAIDDVVIEETPSCLAPSAATGNATSPNAADLSWTENNAATSWQVEWGTTGFTQGSGTLLLTSSNPHGLSGLSGNTTYDFYVRSICAPGDSSTWTFGSFTTPCDIYPVPYFEDFANGVTATCWEEAASGTPATGPTGFGSGDWVNDGFANIGTTGAVKINLWNAGSTAAQDWWISPYIDLNGLYPPFQAEFDFATQDYASSTAANDGLGTDDTLQFLVSLDSGLTWTALMTYDSSNTPVANGGIHVVVDLSAYTGDTVRFAFWGSEGTVDDPTDVDVSVDNFQVVPVCAPTSASITENVCDSYTLPSGSSTVTTSGIYLDTIMNANGCDSLMTIDVTINFNSTASITEAVCGSYTVPSGNMTYNTSGIYMDTIPNASGCDSVITIDLTVSTPTTATISPTVCGSFAAPSGATTYTSSGTYFDIIPNANGCDSLITINLTVLSNSTSTISETACNSYTVPSGNATYFASGTYLDTLPSANGCDSIITINLTITPVNVSVSNLTSITIIASANGAAYQWLDCDNSFSPIAGETSQSFTATANGSYAVEVTENGCADTSICTLVTEVGIDNPVTSQVEIYPNPSNGVINFELGTLKDVSIEITNVTGEVIYYTDNINTSLHTLNLNVAAGMYSIKVRSEGNEEQYKLVIR